MKTRKTLTIAYVCALLVIAVFAVLTHVVIVQVLNQQQGAAEVVNVAGRQRMLSQRIPLLAREYARTGLGEYRSRLEDAVALMTRQHNMLTYPSAGTAFDQLRSDRLRELYDGGGLDRRVTEFLEIAGRVAGRAPGSGAALSESAVLLDAAVVELLDLLDQAVKLYEVESDSAIRGLTRFQLYLLAVLLAVLAAEAALIFRPLVKGLGDHADRLERLAHTDELTKLANRRAFIQQGERELARARRNESPLSALVLDLDRFKQINDTFGHDAGDRVLQGVARVIASLARTTDVIGRTGGEEFCVVMPDTDEAGACTVARRLLEKLSATDIQVSASTKRQMTFSGGVAQLQPGDDLTALMKRADEAMYQAKRSGRARVVAFSRGGEIQPLHLVQD